MTQLRLIYALPEGGVAVTIPAGRRDGEPEPAWLDRVARRCCPADARLVAVVQADELPADRTHRDAWVWDGQRVVVDESRIRPRPAARAAPPRAGAVIAADPRVDALAERMQAEIDRKLRAVSEDLARQAVIEHRRSIEALTVHSALMEGREITPGHFPALARQVADAGQPVTAEAIVAAADEQARRGIQMAAGAA